METPYNPKNILVDARDVQLLLNTYDVTDKINDIGIYRKAFVHKSYCTRKNDNFINGNVECPSDCLPLQEESNERLEYLGDSILSKVVASYLFERYPDENEGFLTKMRTKLVNGKMLAHLSDIVGLKKYIILSKQIEDADGRNSINILEDAFEAFIGAIYIDFKVDGDRVVSRWILSVIESNIDFADLIRHNTNHKDTLCKYFQQNYNYIPKFLESKVEMKKNQKVYTICVKDEHGSIISVGSGSSKKEAENDAAKNALERYACEFNN